MAYLGNKNRFVKNMLTRRKESVTYLATVSRHRWSLQIAMKVDKMWSFQPALQPTSAEVKATLSADSSDVY